MLSKLDVITRGDVVEIFGDGKVLSAFECLALKDKWSVHELLSDVTAPLTLSERVFLMMVKPNSFNADETTSLISPLWENIMSITMDRFISELERWRGDSSLSKKEFFGRENLKETSDLFFNCRNYGMVVRPSRFQDLVIHSMDNWNCDRDQLYKGRCHSSRTNFFQMCELLVSPEWNIESKKNSRIPTIEKVSSLVQTAILTDNAGHNAQLENHLNSGLLKTMRRMYKYKPVV